jgi:hypothetical protein
MKATTSRFLRDFVVGAFAALCASFIPRLAAALPTTPDSTLLTIRVFTAEYVVTTLVFALLVGGVVVVLEWSSNRTPREVFISALAVPALVTGFVNAAAVSNQAKELAEANLRLNMERAKQEGIEVTGTPVRSGARNPRIPSLIPTAFAASEPPPAQTEKFSLAIQLREPEYWVSLGSAETKEAAEAKKREIGEGHGELKVERHGDKFHVLLAGGSALPYSEAVSRAVEIKRQTEGALTPALIAAGVLTE